MPSCREGQICYCAQFFYYCAKVFLYCELKSLLCKFLFSTVQKSITILVPMLHTPDRNFVCARFSASRSCFRHLGEFLLSPICRKNDRDAETEMPKSMHKKKFRRGDRTREKLLHSSKNIVNIGNDRSYGNLYLNFKFSSWLYWKT